MKRNFILKIARLISISDPKSGHTIDQLKKDLEKYLFLNARNHYCMS